MNKDTRPKTISRRKFFPHFSVVLGVFFTGLMVPFLKMIPRLRRISLRKIERLPDGINLLDDLVIRKEHGHVELYSRKCTHLGCRLQKGTGVPLHCPCHGSEFSETGEVLHGPAERPLEKISYQQENEELIWHS